MTAERLFQRAPFLAVAVCLVPLYAYLTTLGYGANYDTYRVLEAWQSTIELGRYVPSRGQGYIIPEFAIGALAAWGGSVASNALSMALSLAAVLMFHDALRRIAGAAALPAALFVMANPHWIIAATTSMDYIYGAFFFVLGVWLLVRGWLVAAMLMLAAGTASRIVYGPLGFGALAFALAAAPPEERRRNLECLVGFCLVSGLFYLPAFIWARATLGFLTHTEPANNYLTAQLVRFAFKSVGMYGMVGAALVAWALGPRLWRLWRGGEWRMLPAPRRIAVSGALATLAYSTAMFLYLPAEVGYQIPSLLAVAALLALLDVPAVLRSALVASQLLLMAVNPDILMVRYAPHGCMEPKNAVDADLGLYLKPGVLVEHAREVRLSDCGLAKVLRFPPPDPWTPLPIRRGRGSRG
ncbi:hypothetical protein [Azospirillum sp. sgz301742]